MKKLKILHIRGLIWGLELDFCALKRDQLEMCIQRETYLVTTILHTKE